jgi:predicted small lipoprotein YifL
MKPVISALCLLALTGCGTAPVAYPPVESAPVVASQEGKDRAIVSEAAKIDAIAPAAKQHTDAQRAAVASAPAADVTRLVKALEAESSQLRKEAATLTKERDEARNQTDRTIIIGGYSLAALLVSAGVATFFLMAQLAFLGPKIGVALIAAGGSVFAMLQAYQWTKAHPWITGVTLLFLVAAASLAVANHAHDKKS